MIGAGKIGRGFIARSMALSGYHVVLIDKDIKLVNHLREHSEYPVRVVAADGVSTHWVGGYSALHISQTEEIARAICDASLVAVSVGVNHLADVADYLADALSVRLRTGAAPLNILTCENMIGSDKRLSDAVLAKWTAEEIEGAVGRIGFVPVCVGKTAPVPTAAMLKEHPLHLIVDSYEEIPVAASAIVGTLPPLHGLKPYLEFDYCIRRKLFIHNMGHAVAAYAGTLKGCAMLDQAMRDTNLRDLVKSAMTESASALRAAYPFAEGLEEYIEGLLALFTHPDMGETLSRIGFDPLRKTSPDDRLAGAHRFCTEFGISAPHIAVGLAAAMFFADPNDEAAARMRARIEAEGAEAFLRGHCGLADPHGVLCAYHALESIQ